MPFIWSKSACIVSRAKAMSVFMVTEERFENRFDTPRPGHGCHVSSLRNCGRDFQQFAFFIGACTHWQDAGPHSSDGKANSTRICARFCFLSASSSPYVFELTLLHFRIAIAMAISRLNCEDGASEENAAVQFDTAPVRQCPASISRHGERPCKSPQSVERNNTPKFHGCEGCLVRPIALGKDPVNEALINVLRAYRHRNKSHVRQTRKEAAGEPDAARRENR